MKHASRKTSARNEIRAALVQAWLQESAEAVGNYLGVPFCEIIWDRRCSGVAVEGHEPLMRSRGGSILDRDNVLLTCRYCHDKVHANVKVATQRGFLVSAYGNA